jgi:uncharacterized SAM-binding protein YcdF (DUF218 family)
MLFSTGFVFAFKEGELMRSLAIENGVPDDAIVLESHANSTYENVTRSQAILTQHGWKRALLVSSPYHMRRALLTWHKNAPEIDVIASPVPYSQFYFRNGGPTLEQFRGLLQEYGAIALYWWRGWI